MPTYTVRGPHRLYIEGRFHDPGSTFTTAERLPNEATLMAAGHLLDVDEMTALVVLDAAGLSSDDIHALTTKPQTAKPKTEKVKA